MAQRSGDDPFPLRAVGDPTVVLAPGYLSGISLKVLSANAVVDTELATAQSGEIAFGFIGASAILALKLDRVIDPFHWITGMEDIPRARFVGVNLGSARDVLADHRNRIALPTDNPRDRSAEAALASDNHDLAVAVLAALLPAICKSVRWANAGAKIGTINLDFAGQFAALGHDRAHRLAQLVQQHEGALGIDVHIAGHSQRGDAFDAASKQSDHAEVFSNRQLA